MIFDIFCKIMPKLQNKGAQKGKIGVNFAWKVVESSRPRDTFLMELGKSPYLGPEFPLFPRGGGGRGRARGARGDGRRGGALAHRSADGARDAGVVGCSS